MSRRPDRIWTGRASLVADEGTILADGWHRVSSGGMVERSSPRKPVIAHFCPSLGRIGGIWTYIQLIKNSRLSEQFDFEVLPLESYKPGLDLGLLRRLVRWLKTLKPDAIHVHTMNASVIHLYWAIKLAKQKNVLVTLHIHIDDCDEYSMLMRILQGEIYERNLLRLAKLHYSVCAYGRTRGRLREFDATSMGVINNGAMPTPLLPVDRNLFAGHGVGEDDVVIFMASRAIAEKGWHLIPAIGRELAQAKAKWKLVLAGDGPYLEEAKKLCQDNPNVIFLGGRSDVPALNAASDIHLAPTRREFMSFSIIEAMQQAKPIVTTYTGGNAELVVDGLTGLLAPVEDASSLGKCLVRLIDSPDLRKSMGLAGRRRIEEKNNLDDMIDSIGRVYEKLLE